MSGTSHQPTRLGPDFFGFFACELAELLSSSSAAPADDVDVSRNGKAVHAICDCNKPLFCDIVGNSTSEVKKELFKALLRETLNTLTEEVDEILDPVIRIRHILFHLGVRKQDVTVDRSYQRGSMERPSKMQKTAPSFSSTSTPVYADLDNAAPGRQADCNIGTCVYCGNSETVTWRTNQDGRKACHSCGLRLGKEKQLSQDNAPGGGFLLDAKNESDKEFGEVDEALKFLLENEDNLQLEQKMKKHLEELSSTLHYMERRLEELLDTAVSQCRSMTHQEKQQLRIFIQKLPPENLQRVVEIICRSKDAPKTLSLSDEIFVDLENLDNVTLWRLYFYVKAAENARKLSGKKVVL